MTTYVPSFLAMMDGLVARESHEASRMPLGLSLLLEETITRPHCVEGDAKVQRMEEEWPIVINT